MEESEGYVPSSTVYRVSYMDYPGLLITAKGTSFGAMRKLLSEGHVNPNNREASEKAFTFFCKKVISWNLQHPVPDESDDDNERKCALCGLTAGDPLPVTVDGLMCLETNMVSGLIVGWIKAITEVNQGKERNSNGGGMRHEDLMSQLAMQQSLGTLPVPKFD